MKNDGALGDDDEGGWVVLGAGGRGAGPKLAFRFHECRGVRVRGSGGVIRRRRA